MVLHLKKDNYMLLNRLAGTYNMERQKSLFNR
uniref:Uncharacterized protein n=1 Tax=Arundo donax TaxID=35708 RepID=A0A0A9H2H0_ARUDO